MKTIMRNMISYLFSRRRERYLFFLILILLFFFSMWYLKKFQFSRTWEAFFRGTSEKEIQLHIFSIPVTWFLFFTAPLFIIGENFNENLAILTTCYIIKKCARWKIISSYFLAEAFLLFFYSLLFLLANFLYVIFNEGTIGEALFSSVFIYSVLLLVEVVFIFLGLVSSDILSLLATVCFVIFGFLTYFPFSPFNLVMFSRNLYPTYRLEPSVCLMGLFFVLCGATIFVFTKKDLISNWR